jgi:prepilin-type N-terminal cleavage/methylation domain-containing protein
MFEAARKSKKGFTLFELLIVMGIAVLLTSLVGGGILFLQNSVGLDKNIRELKTEVQTTQNNAINSFISTNTTSPASFADEKVSIGWSIRLFNNGTSSLNVEKRAVFVQLTNTVLNNPNDLRQEIRDFVNGFSAGNFSCTNADLGMYRMYTGPGELPITLRCADINPLDENLDDYMLTTYTGIILSDNIGGSPILNCRINNEVNLFFTSGYGETILPGRPARRDCQIVIRNASGAVVNTRAVRISEATGSVAICESFCL